MDLPRGTLFLISTPIGNLGDITLRAIDTLREVDLIAAEDTRHSRKLLNRLQIATPVISFHEHNKTRQVKKILADLLAGKSCGLISDAGTPVISDPGYSLIREALRRQIPVTAVPGPTALIPALILSGLPVHRFVFEGFPPAKKGRKKFFERLAGEERTIILYESPHRIAKTVRDIIAYWGDRNIALARELTKKFEEVRRGPATEILHGLEKHAAQGEIVIVVEGLH